MEQEVATASSSTPSLDNLLASSELLDFPDLSDFDATVLAASPFAWGQMTGSAFPVDTGLSEPST
jgi:hypothetical protein